MELLIAAVAGGFVATFLTVAYAQWRKNARLRNLKAAASNIEAAMAVDSTESAKEAEKRAIDEKYAIQALQDAVGKL